MYCHNAITPADFSWSLSPVLWGFSTVMVAPFRSSKSSRPPYTSLLGVSQEWAFYSSLLEQTLLSASPIIWFVRSVVGLAGSLSVTIISTPSFSDLAVAEPAVERLPLLHGYGLWENNDCQFPAWCASQYDIQEEGFCYSFPVRNAIMPAKLKCHAFKNTVSFNTLPVLLA